MRLQLGFAVAECHYRSHRVAHYTHHHRLRARRHRGTASKTQGESYRHGAHCLLYNWQFTSRLPLHNVGGRREMRWCNAASLWSLYSLLSYQHLDVSRHPTHSLNDQACFRNTLDVHLKIIFHVFVFRKTWKQYSLHCSTRGKRINQTTVCFCRPVAVVGAIMQLNQSACISISQGQSNNVVEKANVSKH